MRDKTSRCMLLAVSVKSPDRLVSFFMGFAAKKFCALSQRW